MKPGLIEQKCVVDRIAKKSDTGVTNKIALSAANNEEKYLVARIEKKIDTSAKPYQSYFGGKGSSGTFQTIINVIRPHNVYIEPYLGNGSIFSNKRKSEYSYLNDISKGVCEKWHEILESKCNLRNLDAMEYLKILKFRTCFQTTCLYLDPPYPIETRKSRHRYEHEMTAIQHLELLRYIQELKCDVLISTYPNEMYANELKDWYLIEFESVTRSGKKAIEHLYLNYNPEEITELHDYRYYGKNFRDRERIKRIAKNLESKINFMPNLERNAIFSMIKLKP